jgi:dienelactone hydrolase
LRARERARRKRDDAIVTAVRPPDRDLARIEVVLFHSAYGLTPGVRRWADRLRAVGYAAHTPDLYDGDVFEDRLAAAAKVQELGFDGLIARSREAVAGLPAGLVYAGFSNGGALAESLAATRSGARGALLLHAPLPIRDLGWSTWPRSVPVQVHFAERDPLRSPAVVDALAARVRSSGAAFEGILYPGAGHLFAEPGRREYDPAAAELMFGRALDFLRMLDGERV